jgi:hypothetical protein
MLIHLILALTPLPVLQADAKANAALLDRIQQVETGGHPHPDRAVGDSGKALGWMQCHRECWQDARAECPDIPDYKTACASREWSRVMVMAMARKYGAKTDREIASLWHSGPTYMRRHPGADQHGYFAKVQTKKPLTKGR